VQQWLGRRASASRGGAGRRRVPRPAPDPCRQELRPACERRGARRPQRQPLHRSRARPLEQGHTDPAAAAAALQRHHGRGARLQRGPDHCELPERVRPDRRRRAGSDRRLQRGLQRTRDGGDDTPVLRRARWHDGQHAPHDRDLLAVRQRLRQPPDRRAKLRRLRRRRWEPRVLCRRCSCVQRGGVALRRELRRPLHRSRQLRRMRRQGAGAAHLLGGPRPVYERPVRVRRQLRRRKHRRRELRRMRPRLRHRPDVRHRAVCLSYARPDGMQLGLQGPSRRCRQLRYLRPRVRGRADVPFGSVLVPRGGGDRLLRRLYRRPDRRQQLWHLRPRVRGRCGDDDLRRRHVQRASHARVRRRWALGGRRELDRRLLGRLLRGGGEEGGAHRRGRRPATSTPPSPR
jgi:hypothetical protein